MRELLPDLEQWLRAGERVALATVLSTWGSAPRPAGSFMAVSESGRLAGSVSGGCVEGAVIQAAQEVLAGKPPQRMHFGVADETAWEVGLACGGQIDVFVQALEPAAAEFALRQIEDDQPLVMGTLVDGSSDNLGTQVLVSTEDQTIHLGEIPDAQYKQILSALKSALATKSPQLMTLKGDPAPELFVNPIQPATQLILVGGGHIAVALAEIAKAVDYRIVVVDPRRVFASAERFPHIDELIQEWPRAAFEHMRLDAATAVATLSHDPKIDDPALSAALRSPAFYVGALGSPKSHAKRLARLEELGFSKKELERIKGPIGIDIGAVTPEEIAVAVMAEVVASYHSET